MLKKTVLFYGHLFCLTTAFFLSALLPAQNLYDYQHGRLFANYLLQSHQYELAAEEYERLIFLQPANDTLRGGLLRALRLGARPETGFLRWNDWQNAGGKPDRLLQSEYAKLLVAGKQYGALHTLAATPGLLDESLSRRLDLYALMLEQSWPIAQQRLAGWPADTRLARRSDFEQLVKKGLRQRHKSPAVAGALSVFVPGLGKAYSGQWKDGLIGLAFVGMNAWQAYRRFDQEGADTFWGYIHGGFALGFYLGNVYGSHKAARLHNERQRHKLFHETELLVLPALD